MASGSGASVLLTQYKSATIYYLDKITLDSILKSMLDRWPGIENARIENICCIKAEPPLLMECLEEEELESLICLRASQPRSLTLPPSHFEEV